MAFAESLLKDVGPHLRERHVLQEAVQLNRETWVRLFEASAALREIGAPNDPPR